MRSALEQAVRQKEAAEAAVVTAREASAQAYALLKARLGDAQVVAADGAPVGVVHGRRGGGGGAAAMPAAAEHGAARSGVSRSPEMEFQSPESGSRR
mmetsp:Transcript_12818/g.40929  ORF Transcript_12818/g.40929 Transcript_12818/m.40929 type:complete len:97 (-) Transcript_12818:251-541(-)